MTMSKTVCPHLLIFTDLDGTLLDHHTYSFAAAQEALDSIAAASIPLILCSSKTRAEMETWRRRLQNGFPFVSENGGAVYFPPESPRTQCALMKEDYYVVELGMPRTELLRRFVKLKDLFGTAIRGLSEMDVDELARLTGLSTSEAELACDREYSEPFLFYGDEDARSLLSKTVASLGLRVTRGGRFYHLLAGNDKGKAVRTVIEAYMHTAANLKTIAVGDSANDIPMLQVVDVPVLVQKPDAGYEPDAVRVCGTFLAPGIGPEGWNSAVLQLLREHLL
ncbi:MAG TPA: HAD-IIB family hydrolase [Thermodesulfobacteriota bacterium]|nr:HAD-IIB family hydrolase [Thermodesulfobacteriota bacterium]